MCMFCRSLFVLLYFFFWPLCCLSLFDLRILMIPLVSSNSSWNVTFGKMVPLDGPIGGSFYHYLFIVEIQVHIHHVNLIQVSSVITVSWWSAVVAYFVSSTKFVYNKEIFLNEANKRATCMNCCNFVNTLGPFSIGFCLIKAIHKVHCCNFV